MRGSLHITLALVGSEMAHGVIVAGALVPHGDFAYDPTLPPTGKNASALLHAASVEVGRRLSTAEIDLVLLITPHGVTSERDTGFYDASEASGYAKIGDDLHNASHDDYQVGVNCTIDVNATEEVVSKLQAWNVTALGAWADSEPFPLRWGEGVPLLLLAEGGFVASRAILASLPSRRLVSSSAMTTEMRRLGRALGDALPEDRRVAVVVSGDLAHTHEADGPYGFSPAAEPFDRAVGAWLRDIANASSLVVEAASLVDDALSCGYLGLVMLLGILQAEAERARVAFDLAPPGVTGPFHPTYYGMATALYQRAPAAPSSLSA